ncbi:MAG: type IVB secretion system protein IcmV [Gammaproteobacteria bacterium]|nr:type IVB secretion system protein IcmV [Gammaproteobacteria bacterium]
MALKDVFKVTRKTFFDPTGWIGYESVKQTTTSIWAILKSLFFPPEAVYQETFEQAMARQGLTEEDVEASEQRYLLFAYFFVVLGSIAFVMSFYFLFHHETLAGCVLAIATAALLFSQAFKYHFWYFQIKYRKLGCTFKEWRQGKPFDSEGPKL